MSQSDDVCSLNCEVEWVGLSGLEVSEIFLSAVGGGEAIATLPIALDARENSDAGVKERIEPSGEPFREPSTEDLMEETVAGLELALLGDLTSNGGCSVVT